MAIKAAELWRRAEAIIGEHRFHELVKEHRDGAPASRHRMIDQLIQLQAASLGVLSAVREDAAVVTVPELESVLAFAEEGRQFATPPAWQEVQRGFGAAGEYLHAVGVLQVASLLRVHHPATEFQISSGERREPDIILVVTDQLPLAVEVKALDAFWQPSTAVDLADARRLIRKALANAGTVLGQLRAERPGVLALVGLYMSDQTYRTLVRGFEHHLGSDGTKIPQVLGLAVANLRSRVESTPGLVSPLLEQQSVIRRNPAYSGRLQIDDDWAGPWRLATR
jgi:hypothetical protein